MDWNDPQTQRALWAAATGVLPFASVLGTMLLGRMFAYMDEKPGAGMVLVTVLVGVLLAAITIATAASWYYVHFEFGWLPRAWGWAALVIWICATISAFEVPRRGMKHRRGVRTGVRVS